LSCIVSRYGNLDSELSYLSMIVNYITVSYRFVDLGFYYPDLYLRRVMHQTLLKQITELDLKYTFFKEQNVYLILHVRVVQTCTYGTHTLSYARTRTHTHIRTLYIVCPYGNMIHGSTGRCTRQII
jgi:hypothetical protein